MATVSVPETPISDECYHSCILDTGQQIIVPWTRGDALYIVHVWRGQRAGIAQHGNWGQHSIKRLPPFGLSIERLRSVWRVVWRNYRPCLLSPTSTHFTSITICSHLTSALLDDTGESSEIWFKMFSFYTVWLPHSYSRVKPLLIIT